MAAIRKAAAGPSSRSPFGAALARLARRDYSEQEIRRALAEEGHAPGDVDDIVARLKSARLINDTAYAERFTRTRLIGRGHGRARIRQGLRSRGVPLALVDQALADAQSDGTEREALTIVAARYWRAHRDTRPALRVRRLWTFLLRRGFPEDLVHERLRALWPGHDDVLAALLTECGAHDVGDERDC